MPHAFSRYYLSETLFRENAQKEGLLLLFKKLPFIS
jgi:hypothetical protein